ncbi:CTB family bacteriocin [Pelatocladus sp. BLCC-F211]|uniref:CTB family bacteriocin n=1 Tax=Pelatocladus sp. BLCC-F211 TaxID=3342752 RepID=UPI0035B778A9
MSNEINKATELSEQELDVVAGGAIELTEVGIFQKEANNLDSALLVGPQGTLSATSADELNIEAAGLKNIKVGQ